MHSKSQVNVVKEILSFAIGISVIISFALFVSGLLIPNIRDYTIDKRIDNLVNYIDSSIYSVYALSEKIRTGNITLDIPLPEKIADSVFSLKISENKLCILLKSYGSSKCINPSLPAGVYISGYYISGTDLRVKLEKEENITLYFMNTY